MTYSVEKVAKIKILAQVPKKTVVSSFVCYALSCTAS